MSKLKMAIKEPEKALEVLKYEMSKIRGKRNYKRFIVLSRSRTGSNMLISLLNSHPNVRAEGEIFSSLNGKNYKEILDSTFSKEPKSINAKGFKIFYYHPVDYKDCGVWEYIENEKDIYVIHLKRRNILRSLISRKIASLTNEWKTKESKDSHKINSVEFSVEELKEGFNQTRNWENEGDKKFGNHPIQSIYYEDLVVNPEKEFRKITDLLNLQFVSPTTNLKKQNPGKLYELISNYEELKSDFQGTEWNVFFED